MLVKENHLRVAGGITAAVAALRERADGFPLEVEAETIEQVAEALDGRRRADPARQHDAGGGRRARSRSSTAARQLEASGGVSLATVRAYAETGVDFISVGALTHGARSLHVSLEVL